MQQQKRRRGRPKKSERLDTSDLFTGVWFMMDAISRYWELADAGKEPSPELRTLLVDFQHAIEAYMKMESMVKQPRDFTRLDVLDRCAEPLTKIYWDRKGKTGREALADESCKLAIRTMLRDVGMGTKLNEDVVQKLAISKKKISEFGGPSLAAEVQLAKVLGIGSRRTLDAWRKERANLEAPYVLEGDPLGLEALKLFLRVAGYSSRSVEQSVSVLRRRKVTG